MALRISIILSLIFAVGCGAALTRGSSSTQKSRGMLYTLDFVDPNNHVGVAFTFPSEIDAFATDDGSYLSMQNGDWRVDRVIRFTKETEHDEIDISFNYKAASRIFNFANKIYKLEVNQLIVVRFDKDSNFETEILNLNPETTNAVLIEMGYDPNIEFTETIEDTDSVQPTSNEELQERLKSLTGPPSAG